MPIVARAVHLVETEAAMPRPHSAVHVQYARLSRGAARALAIAYSSKSSKKKRTESCG